MFEIVKLIFSTPVGKKILLSVIGAIAASFIFAFLIPKGTILTILQLGCCIVITANMSKFSEILSAVADENKDNDK